VGKVRFSPTHAQGEMIRPLGWLPRQPFSKPAATTVKLLGNRQTRFEVHNIEVRSQSAVVSPILRRVVGSR